MLVHIGKSFKIICAVRFYVSEIFGVGLYVLQLRKDVLLLESFKLLPALKTLKYRLIIKFLTTFIFSFISL